MSSLAQRPEAPRVVEKCDRCKRRIIRARLQDGAAVSIEWCAPGRGDVGLVASLFEGSAPLAVAAKGSGYRRHSCPPPRCLVIPAHSAPALLSGGKKGGEPSISYRTFPPGQPRTKPRKPGGSP